MRAWPATTSEGFIRPVRITCHEGFEMAGFLEFFKRKKDVMCPECEKVQKHVKLVEVDGKTMECPECHYTHLIHR
jgi:hypothetical protein